MKNLTIREDTLIFIMFLTIIACFVVIVLFHGRIIECETQIRGLNDDVYKVENMKEVK